MKTEKNDTPTPEQAAWDEKNRYYTRNWIITGAVLVTAILAATWWIVATWVAPAVGLIGVDLPKGDPRTKEATDGLKTAMSMIILLMGTVLLVGLPLKAIARNCDWILGNRPSADFKYRVPKPIDMDIEQISDDVQTATVGEYVFRVKTRTHKRRFGQDKHSYEIRESNDKINLITTLNYSLFEGKDALYVAKSARDTISMQLEDNTDYFKTVSSV